MKKELIPDSCGADRFRGGCGQGNVFRVLAEGTIQVSFRNDRIRNAAQGMMGGAAGQRGRILVNGKEVPGKTSLSLKRELGASDGTDPALLF